MAVSFTFRPLYLRYPQDRRPVGLDAVRDGVRTLQPSSPWPWSLYRLASPGSVQGDRAGSHSGTGVVSYSGCAWFESDWGFLLVSSGSPGKSGHDATQAELLTGALNKLRMKVRQTDRQTTRRELLELDITLRRRARGVPFSASRNSRDTSLTA